MSGPVLGSGAVVMGFRRLCQLGFRGVSGLGFIGFRVQGLGFRV